MNTPSFHDSTDGKQNRWILVVDDEVPMLHMLEAMLGIAGWTARTASSGAEAIALIDSADTPPSVLICDVLMPKQDGMALTRQIVAKLPAIKVVLVSGRLTDLSWWPADFRHYRFLAKPFTSAELLKAVNESFLELDGGS
jgi:DNA-binding NtrC family response regulator